MGSLMFTDDIKEHEEKVERLLDQLSNLSMERSKLSQTLSESNLRTTTQKFIQKVCSLKGVTTISAALIPNLAVHDCDSNMSRSGAESSRVSGGNPVRRFVLKHNPSLDEIEAIPNEDIRVMEMNSSREKHLATFSNLNTLSSNSTTSNYTKTDTSKLSKNADNPSHIFNNMEINIDKQSLYVYKGKIETFEKILDITRHMGAGKHSEGLIQIIGALANSLIVEKSKILDGNYDFNKSEKEFCNRKIETALKMTQILTQKQEIQKARTTKDHKDEACCFC